MDDLRRLLNARGGAVYASLTPSGAMFEMVRAVAEQVPGDNRVTTALEHPSSQDAAAMYAQRLGKTLRVAASNPTTGNIDIDIDSIVDLIDERTCLLVLIHASNISGAKIDLHKTPVAGGMTRRTPHKCASVPRCTLSRRCPPH